MSTVRVRMFRQGLGDCFLLTFPGTGGEVHVLIDCGVLVGTPDAQMKMQTTAQHILDASNGQLHALVATHEHWDHIGGFAQAQELFGPNHLQVGEVWMAWTEKPDDPMAMEIDKRRANALKRVVSAAKALAPFSDPGAKRTEQGLHGLLEFWGGLGAAGRRTTHSALEWLRARTDPKPPKYLEPGMDPFPIPGVDPDVARVYVLGPPRDARLIKKSDPSKRTSEVYELEGASAMDGGFFAAVDALAAGNRPDCQPFEDWFRVDEDAAKQRDFFQKHYGFAGEDWRRIEHAWLGLAGRLALQLDSDTNNTSLVLAFELCKSKRVLLFPADAQVGNWLSWFPGEVRIGNQQVPVKGLEWQVEENGQTRKVTAADLLARTVLYKVGHHGSHNATLKQQGLELMLSEDLAAMLPVDRKMAEKMKWLMPFPGLFEQLQESSKGRILDLDQGVTGDAPQWQRFPGRTESAKDWLDLHVNL